MRGSWWKEPNGYSAYSVEAFFPESPAVRDPEAALSRVINLALDAIEKECPLAEGHRFYIGVQTYFGNRSHAYVQAHADRATMIDQVLKTLSLDQDVEWHQVFSNGSLTMELVNPHVDSVEKYPYDDMDYMQSMIHNLHLVSPVTYHSLCEPMEC